MKNKHTINHWVRTPQTERELLVELNVAAEDQKRFLKLDRQLEKEGFALGVGILAAPDSEASYAIGKISGGDVATSLTLEQVERFLSLRKDAKGLVKCLQGWLYDPECVAWDYGVKDLLKTIATDFDYRK